MPVIVFWGLDGFFLWQERLYRRLYDNVRAKMGDEIDFSMDVTPFKTGKNSPKWIYVVLSRTLISFHGILILSIIAVMAFTLIGGHS